MGDNALEIGMFGEMHNSDILIKRCAKFICADMTDSLNQNWMEKIQESPKLMLQIIKNLRDVHENKLHEIRRMEQGIEQWVHGGRINAIAFEVDHKVWLRGIGLYGAMDNSTFDVHIKVFLNDDCLLEETKEYKPNGSANPIKLFFASPVKVKPNRRYDITTSITGGPTLSGAIRRKLSNPTELTRLTSHSSPVRWIRTGVEPRWAKFPPFTSEPRSPIDHPALTASSGCQCTFLQPLDLWRITLHLHDKSRIN